MCPTLCDPLDGSLWDMSWKEYWNGLPFPPPGDLPDPGIKPSSPTSPAGQADFFIAEPWGKSKPYNLGPLTVQGNVSTTNRGVPVDLIP